MTEFTITSFRAIDAARFAVVYTDGGSPARTVEQQQPVERIASLMAEYGISDPGEALDLLLHGAHFAEYAQGLDPRDDPATVAGWIAGTGPDAETITTYRAESTRDAGGAFRCRVDAVKADHLTISDPDGLLPTFTPDPEVVRHYMAQADIARWENMYGGLPESDEGPSAPLALRG